MCDQQFGAVPRAWDPRPMGLKGPIPGMPPAFPPVVTRGGGRRSVSPLPKWGTEAR